MKFTKYAKYLGVAALAMGLATGCQTTGSSSAGTSSDTVSADKSLSASEQKVQNIISDAKSALKVAVDGGYAWRDTGKFIKQAEKSLAAGDVAKATSLATKALEQTEMAKKQSIEQDKAVAARFK
ncbi:MAG: hypothetical protein OQL19_10910 [Gammaproteobacteria bacterium]|nr:hypothetical protein [Gammaproteobacteria bacterium]